MDLEGRQRFSFATRTRGRGIAANTGLSVSGPSPPDGNLQAVRRAQSLGPSAHALTPRQGRQATMFAAGTLLRRGRFKTEFAFECYRRKRRALLRVAQRVAGGVPVTKALACAGRSRRPGLSPATLTRLWYRARQDGLAAALKPRWKPRKQLVTAKALDQFFAILLARPRALTISAVYGGLPIPAASLSGYRKALSQSVKAKMSELFAARRQVQRIERKLAVGLRGLG